MAKNRGFNFFMVGFKDQSTTDNYLRCPIHNSQLIKDPKDPETWICPSCGLPYEEKEATHETSPTSKFGTNKGPMLLQKNNKKPKLISEQGDIIPEDDTLTIQEMQQGLRVLKYHEEKVEVMKKF